MNYLLCLANSPYYSPDKDSKFTTKTIYGNLGTSLFEKMALAIMAVGSFLSRLIVIHINTHSDTHHGDKESAPRLLLSWSRDENDPSTNIIRILV